jgi:predicted RNA-binding Zn ribbon-like protein
VSADPKKEREDQYGPAPGELELVRQFVNSVDFDEGAEELTSPSALADWLAAHGFDPGPGPGETDLARAIEFREALRALLLANHGEPLPPEAASALEAAAEGTAVELRVGAEGLVSLQPAAPGVDGLVAKLLAIAREAQIDGTWGRLKVCPAETCAWAFYDESRNSSRTWCSMGVCGNRAKTRAYRRRQREGAERE